LIIITITYAIVSNELEIQLLEEKSDYNYSNSTKVINYNYDYFYLGKTTRYNMNDCLG